MFVLPFDLPKADQTGKVNRRKKCLIRALLGCKGHHIVKFNSSCVNFDCDNLNTLSVNFETVKFNPFCVNFESVKINTPSVNFDCDKFNSSIVHFDSVKVNTSCVNFNYVKIDKSSTNFDKFNSTHLLSILTHPVPICGDHKITPYNKNSYVVRNAR